MPASTTMPANSVCDIPLLQIWYLMGIQQWLFLGTPYLITLFFIVYVNLYEGHGFRFCFCRGTGGVAGAEAAHGIRELRDVLQDLQHKSLVQNWCETESWKLLKELATSGLGGMHLVVFKVERNHRLPPTTLSPGDMVCVRTCDNRGAVTTSCLQGFVNSLGDDGCSISVALESRHGDPTFSKLFGKSVRIDRIQGLADTLTYEPTWITQCPLLLLDTRMPYGSLSIGCEENLDPAGTGSFYNEGEADIVVQHVFSLIYAGVNPTTIMVQSPYVAQVQLLRDMLNELPGAVGTEVATIDSFQGREADAVIISMVRSNALGAVGFLGDSRRINVAITRARKHVAVVCDSSTICHNTFLARLLRHIRHFGRVKHAEPGRSGGSGLGMNPMLPSIN
ncbi:hypothetical protein K1719_044212 [Acacia pycnantha]|nr:hypothetical protein K1719_044212 [Acacia pycnantha]